MGKTMKYVIIKNGIPIETVEATDINEAMDAAVLITNGVFDDVAEVGSEEYKTAVQARGAKASENMNTEIKASREKANNEAGGIAPYIAPYTQQAELAGKESGMVEGAKDFYSLPGRLIGTAGEQTFESMKVPSEQREGMFEQMVTSPATGFAASLAPLAMLGGGGIIAAGGTPFIAGLGEGAIIGAGTSAFRGMTEEDYGIADAAVETILSTILGGTLRGASAAAINKAKSFINQSGKFTPSQIEYIYSKLGMTGGGTKPNLEKSVPYEFDKLGDIEYSYRSKAPTDADNLPKSVRDVLQADFEKGWQKGAEQAFDVGNVIPDETIHTYERSIRNGIANRTINPEQATNKFKILEEYKQWKQHLDQINTEMGDEPVDLNKLIKDAQYFYQKDPELGNIIIDNIEAQYKMNYVMMMADPELATNGLELAPLADLKSKFLNLNTITKYTANPPAKATPRTFKFMEPGSWASPATRAVNTPERARNVGNVVKALRMPSIVATQDVTKYPEYINLNQMRSK